MNGKTIISIILLAGAAVAFQTVTGVSKGRSYTIVDTGQRGCYSDMYLRTCPEKGSAYFGQDTQYDGVKPSYTDNSDGTITDNNTGLMWQKDPGKKMTFDEAVAAADYFNLAGYTDWRLPTIKELYSLILFSGLDPSADMYGGTSGNVPFIDTNYFNFSYGDAAAGERVIDSQFVSSTVYVGSQNNFKLAFGVNFADGRIKGYGTRMRNGDKTFYVLYVRGNKEYGKNLFKDNGNGTVADNATGLTWQKDDSGKGMAWGDALAYCENLEIADQSDWRLPNAKELQSILDYTRAPDLGSAAIDPIFNATSITNELGVKDWPFYWTSTTHANSMSGSAAAYLSFGRGLGYMFGSWIDVHGAGSQRSDPKSGSPAAYPTGRGPQGDAIRINNYARCVRGGAAFNDTEGLKLEDTPGQKKSSSMGTMSPQTGASAGGFQSGPPSPPQGAIDACSGKSEGDACSFLLPHGPLNGECGETPDGITACMPEGSPPGGPPPMR